MLGLETRGEHTDCAVLWMKPTSKPHIELSDYEYYVISVDGGYRMFRARGGKSQALRKENEADMHLFRPRGITEVIGKRYVQAGGELLCYRY